MYLYIYVVLSPYRDRVVLYSSIFGSVFDIPNSEGKDRVIVKYGDHQYYTNFRQARLGKRT